MKELFQMDEIKWHSVIIANAILSDFTQFKVHFYFVITHINSVKIAVKEIAINTLISCSILFSCILSHRTYTFFSLVCQGSLLAHEIRSRNHMYLIDYIITGRIARSFQHSFYAESERCCSAEIHDFSAIITRCYDRDAIFTYVFVLLFYINIIGEYTT